MPIYITFLHYFMDIKLKLYGYVSWYSPSLKNSTANVPQSKVNTINEIHVSFKVLDSQAQLRLADIFVWIRSSSELSSIQLSTCCLLYTSRTHCSAIFR